MPAHPGRRQSSGRDGEGGEVLECTEGPYLPYPVGPVPIYSAEYIPLQSLEDIESMPPTSLSTTPLFQHLLSSLPSLRGQIKDAVTASMKQWLLDIRNVSAQIGSLALEAMEMRTRRWRSRREKDSMLKSARVGSAVETITYEKTECVCGFDHSSFITTNL